MPRASRRTTVRLRVMLHEHSPPWQELSSGCAAGGARAAALAAPISPIAAVATQWRMIALPLPPAAIPSLAPIEGSGIPFERGAAVRPAVEHVAPRIDREPHPVGHAEARHLIDDQA